MAAIVLAAGLAACVTTGPVDPQFANRDISVRFEYPVWWVAVETNQSDVVALCSV